MAKFMLSFHPPGMKPVARPLDPALSHQSVLNVARSIASTYNTRVRVVIIRPVEPLTVAEAVAAIGRRLPARPVPAMLHMGSLER